MTITPTDPTAPMTIAAPAGPTAPGDPVADFLAEILRALEPTGDTAATAPDAEGTSLDQTPDAALEPTVLGVVPPAMVGQLASALPTPLLSAPGRANVAREPEGVLSGPGSNICPPGGASSPSPTTDEAPETPTAWTGLPREGTAAVGPAAAAPAAATGEQVGPVGVPTNQGPPDPSTGSELLGHPGAVATPAGAVATPAGVAPAATTTVATSTSEVAPAHVTSQVFPEVTSLVSRGNGAHRITLTLNPEALGEVRVVMSVRDRSVVVRLAAGQDARRALIDGSPELSRLLELAGASETRIVVRDLAASSTSTGSGTGTDPEAGPGTGRSHDQHAGTRAHHPATDGTNDGTIRSFRSTSGANPPQSIEPVTDARTARVDVTM